jgi:uncharacterized protein (DUF433 family)
MIAAPINHILLDERGIAYIGQTGLRVADIAVDLEIRRLTPDQILANYPSLSPAQLHAALSHFFDHREQVLECVRRELAEYEQERALHPNPLARAELRARLPDTARTERR